MLVKRMKKKVIFIAQWVYIDCNPNSDDTQRANISEFEQVSIKYQATMFQFYIAKPLKNGSLHPREVRQNSVELTQTVVSAKWKSARDNAVM